MVPNNTFALARATVLDITLLHFKDAATKVDATMSGFRQNKEDAVLFRFATAVLGCILMSSLMVEGLKVDLNKALQQENAGYFERVLNRSCSSTQYIYTSFERQNVRSD